MVISGFVKLFIVLYVKRKKNVYIKYFGWVYNIWSGKVILVR